MYVHYLMLFVLIIFANKKLRNAEYSEYAHLQYNKSIKQTQQMVYILYPLPRLKYMI